MASTMSIESSRFCVSAWYLIQAAQRKHPKRSIKSFTCMIGQFLSEFFFPFNTIKDLMLAISFLVEKGLEENCVADIFNFSISKELRDESTVRDFVNFYNENSENSTSTPLTSSPLVYLQPWLQPILVDKASPAPTSPAPTSPAPRKTALPSPSALSPPPLSATLPSSIPRKTAPPSLARRSSALRKPALPSPRLLALQSLSQRLSQKLLALRSLAPPSPAPPSRPYYEPTHYTSTPVPSTYSSDNSKGFLERYQVFFENKSLVPLDYNKYPGLNEDYHEASELNFIYDISINHCNSSMLYQSRSRLMVVLPPEIQTLIGIFPLIEESNEAITLDRFAFLTVCNRKLISAESLKQSTEAKVLRDVIIATLESFYKQQRIFEDNFFLPELVFIWITKFLRSNTVIQQTIDGVHNTCFTGKIIGIWIGQDGLIFLDIRGDSGPWIRWLNVFNYSVEWNLKTAG